MITSNFRQDGSGISLRVTLARPLEGGPLTTAFPIDFGKPGTLAPLLDRVVGTQRILNYRFLEFEHDFMINSS